MIDRNDKKMNLITKDKKGFTLIELLAVIVILAIIILIAASNIGAMTQTARKNVLAVEGETLISSAKTAYQVDVMNGEFDSNTTVCYSLNDLKNQGYYDKGDDKYHGSVLVTPSGTQYTYKVWISNNVVFLNKDGGHTSGNVKGKDADVGKTAASDNCQCVGTLMNR